jgi:hypothetical protein
VTACCSRASRSDASPGALHDGREGAPGQRAREARARGALSLFIPAFHPQKPVAGPGVSQRAPACPSVTGRGLARQRVCGAVGPPQNPAKPGTPPGWPAALRTPRNVPKCTTPPGGGVGSLRHMTGLPPRGRDGRPVNELARRGPHGAVQLAPVAGFSLATNSPSETGRNRTTARYPTDHRAHLARRSAPLRARYGTAHADADGRTQTTSNARVTWSTRTRTTGRDWTLTRTRKVRQGRRLRTHGQGLPHRKEPEAPHAPAHRAKPRPPHACGPR